MTIKPATPEYLSGANAGRRHLAPSLNPYPDDTPKYVEWHRGWQKATAESIAERVRLDRQFDLKDPENREHFEWKHGTNRR